MQREDRILLSLFSISLCTMLMGILMWRLYPDSIYSMGLAFTVLLPPILLLGLHGYLTLGTHRIILFFLLSSSTGLLFEIQGLKYGTFFGSYYQYGYENFEIMNLSLFSVPIVVIFYWALFIYLAYSITNSFLARFNIDLPTNKTGRAWQIAVKGIEGWVSGDYIKTISQ